MPIKGYTLLKYEQCAAIVDAALEILATTGCRIDNAAAVDILKKAGCREEDGRVHIPTAITKHALETVPSSFVLYDRDGQPALEMNATDCHIYCPGTSAVNRIDPRTRIRRECVKTDILDAAILEDHLDNFPVICGLGAPSDCNPILSNTWEVRYLLEGSTKPFSMGCLSKASVKVEVDLLGAVRGSVEDVLAKPNVLCAAMALSPLHHLDESLDCFMYMCELGLPVSYIGTPALGSTGPVTMAGSLAVGLADSFVGLVIQQLINPGAPFLGTCFVDHMDLRTTGNVMTSPEWVKVSAASGDLFRYLNIPSMAHMSASDSPLFDGQAAFDIASSVYMGELNGICMNFFMGYLEGGMTGDLSALVYGNEIIDYVRDALAPIEVDEDTLALDVIDEVGPAGNFLSEEHTIDHMGGSFMPDILFRNTYETWKAGGSKDIVERANERVLQIIEAGPHTPLSSETIAKLDAIVEQAEKDFS